MLVCGLDFETSGIEPTKHRVTEVGAVLWYTERSMPLRVEGYLVDPGDDCQWEKEAVEVSGITPELVKEFGIDSSDALSRLLYMMGCADCVCAHNGERFDRPMFQAWCQREGAGVPEKLWIDTTTDIYFSATIPKDSKKKLAYLAADLGFVNPFPHRAVTDVLTMLRILSNYDIDRVCEMAREPFVQIEAIVSYEEKDLAKARGYGWRIPYPGARKEKWIRDIKKCFLEQEIAEAPFKIAILAGAPVGNGKLF
jgi:DNA polymerase III subunit epsilon